MNDAYILTMPKSPAIDRFILKMWWRLLARILTIFRVGFSVGKPMIAIDLTAQESQYGSIRVGNDWKLKSIEKNTWIFIFCLIFSSRCNRHPPGRLILWTKAPTHFIFIRITRWERNENNKFLIWSLFRFTFICREERQDRIMATILKSSGK